MLKQKRELPEAMANAERRIEEWRSSLVRAVDARADVAAYLLGAVACARMSALNARLMPQYSFQLEQVVRKDLFGLQFGLSAIESPPPQGVFNQSSADQMIDLKAKRTLDVVDNMAAYAHARDVFITYAWGGYELEIAGEDHLKFIDAPESSGARDRAEQVIDEEIQLDKLNCLRSAMGAPIRFIWERSVQGLPPLPLDGLSSEQFVSCWMALRSDLLPHWHCGQSPVMLKTDLLSILQKRLDLTSREASRFVELISFNRKAREPLALFHCPLVPVTDSSLHLIPPAFLFSDLAGCVPRLMVHRGPGLERFSNEVEAYLLSRLEDQFACELATVTSRVRYSGEKDSGDIDLVLYEKDRNRLLIGMAKAFILPDTAEEVTRANQALELGLGQLQRARQWLDQLDFGRWTNALKTPLSSSRPTVGYVLIGNGFSGSDYLPIPEWASCVDARYLLMSRFRGKSAFDAIDEYDQRIALESSRAASEIHCNSVHLAGVTIEFPGWTVEVQLPPA